MAKVLTKKASGRQKVRIAGGGQYDWEDAGGAGAQLLAFATVVSDVSDNTFEVLPAGGSSSGPNYNIPGIPLPPCILLEFTPTP